MTKTQQKKLETLIGELDALRIEVNDTTTLLAQAKSILIWFLNRNGPA